MEKNCPQKYKNVPYAIVFLSEDYNSFKGIVLAIALLFQSEIL